MPELDRYDAEGLDDEDYDGMSIEDRLAVEQELRRRDREQGFDRRGDGALIYGEVLAYSFLANSVMEGNVLNVEYNALQMRATMTMPLAGKEKWWSAPRWTMLTTKRYCIVPEASWTRVQATHLVFFFFAHLYR